MKYIKFLWFLTWFTPTAIVGGFYLSVYLWWDDVCWDYYKNVKGNKDDYYG